MPSLRTAGLLSALAVCVLAGCLQPTIPPTTQGSAPPPQTEYTTLVLSTSAGEITIALYPDAAPATVHHLENLTKAGYYDGRAFYRVVPGHVIQVTDAAGGATDDPGRVPLEVDARHHFSAGAAGIARDVDPNSGGPELFIMDYATSHLDGNYTVFGQVVAGMDVVHAIARVPAVDAPRLPPGAPNPAPFDRMAIDPVTIQAARISKVSLAPAQAATLPLQVAKNVRVGDYRHSLQYPADLRAGTQSTLTWYIRAYNGQPLPAAAQVAIRVEGQPGAIPVSLEAGTEGGYVFSWQPAAAGPVLLTLEVQGISWATLQATVAGPS